MQNKYFKLSVLFFALIVKNISAQQWHAVNPYPDTQVYTFYPDTANNQMYVGGSFSAVGALNKNYFAIWDGSNWSTYGANWWDFNGGIPYGIKTFEIYNNQLYAAGDFAGPIGSLAMWDGISWNSVDSGVYASTSLFSGNGGIFSLKNFNGKLWALGSFRYKNFFTTWDTLNSITIWDGTLLNLVTDSTGTQKGLDNPSNTAGFEGMDMIIHNNNLCISGYFTKVAGVNTPAKIARFDGQHWYPVGSSIGLGEVLKLCSYNGNLYATGYGSGGHIYQFNGTNWIPLGNFKGINPTIFTMAVYHNDLVVAGSFDSVDNIAAKNIARWNGITWSAFGSGITNPINTATIYCLGVFQDNLYVGVALSPNPAKDKLTLTLKNPTEKQYQFILYDITGREQKHFLFSKSITIDISNLAQGVYIYKVIADNGVVIAGKFIKQ
jgi:hypothetical protein